MRENSRGFAIIELAIVLTVLGAITLGGIAVYNHGKQNTGTKASNTEVANDSSKQSGPQPVNWQFNSKEWVSMGGAPPECPNPLLEITPVDASLVTSVLYPGQYRSGNYKAHGGFRFDNSNAADITIKAPMDGTLVGLKRYKEQGELQYLVTIQNACGIQYRFDHLYMLSDKLQAVAEKTPEPTDDTRSLPLDASLQIDIKAGDVVATAVGFPAHGNIAVDFGVYDLREQNDVSKNSKWAALHQTEANQAFYGLCWLDLLPGKDAKRLKALDQADLRKPAISDYCDVGHTTLEYNNGQPTNG
jgi:hypothetical protein